MINFTNSGDAGGFMTRLSMTQILAARGAALLAGCVLLASLLGAPREIDGERAWSFEGSVSLAALDLGDESLAAGPTEAVTRELRRARTLLNYSARFNVDAELTAVIYDIALQERIDPELAFRVVYAESRFNPRAISSAGALGLAQVMPSTAQIFDPDLGTEDLFDAEVNLRIGFRFLRDMLDKYPGDPSLALLAYNRGPSRLKELLDRGLDPRNGYASSVLEGYKAADPELQ